jgi:glycosyltransferase involved in cell wall biosynthesis
MENLSRFDIVVIHGLWLYPSHATGKAVHNYRDSLRLEKLRPKLFVMPHGMLDPYFQRAPERRLKAIRNWFYWKLIESKVINNADGVLFTCEAELLLAREPFRPYHPKRELNVGFGIPEPPRYVPEMRAAFLRQCPQVEDKPYILFLGRIHEKKGIDLLIQAYASIRKDDSPKLVIAGPGLESTYGNSISELVKQHNIESSVHFSGMLSGNAKWGAFYGCELFALPSHQENFGISVVEALACGKAVLISNQVNIWREIKKGGAGLVAADTLEGTRKSLMDWMKLSVEEKSELQRHARETYKRNFAIGPAALQTAKTLDAN